jgi:inorganic triphosphatase YgiF
METEVKLCFENKESLLRVAESDLFRKFCVTADPVTVTLENYYLDTKDHKVLNRNGSVRRRIVSGKDSFIEETVKYGGGAASGLHRRFEWNFRTDDDKFIIESFKKGVSNDGDPVELLDEVFENVTDEDLVVLCFNSFERTTYNLSYNDSIIEACFDSGVIYNTDKSVSEDICELELELEKGSDKDLTELSNLIKGAFGCSTLDKSKFQRTLELAKRG